MAGLRPRRRGRDLNPRRTFRPVRDFQSRSLDRSDTSPGPQQSTPTGIKRPHGQSPGDLQKAPTSGARRNGLSLGTATHSADQRVLGDAVAPEKLRCALEVNRVRQRLIGLVSLLWQSGRPKDVDDMLSRDQLRGDQQPPSVNSPMAFTLVAPSKVARIDEPSPMISPFPRGLTPDAVETGGRCSSLERMIVRDRKGGHP